MAAVRPLLLLALVAALAGGSTAHAAPRSTPVPILAYHVVGDPPPGAPQPGLYVSVADFRAQMAWLARHGYHPVTLDAVRRHWQRGAALPPKPIALTFDDGYPEHVDVVRPILRSYRWPAMLNLHIGNLTPARVRTADRRRLGDRRAHVHAPRPDDPRPGRAAARGRGLAALDRARVRPAGLLLLLPVEPLRRDGDRGGQGGGVLRRRDRAARARVAPGALHARPVRDPPRRRRRRTGRKAGRGSRA